MDNLSITKRVKQIYVIRQGVVVLVEMSTHAAQTGLHTNKTTRTKFKKMSLFYIFFFLLHSRNGYCS